MTAPPLSRTFFERDARVVARALIGTQLVARDSSSVGGYRIARIVETEAYRGPKDAACHARFGLTKRTRSLFAAPGHAYVFLIYGMYDCFNVTCFGEGKGHAVLVRAVEPGAGCSDGFRGDGPGRLTRALGITRAHDGVDVCGAAPVVIVPGENRAPIGTSARVGVAYAGAIAEAPWRFYERDNPHVSRPSKKSIGLGPGA